MKPTEEELARAVALVALKDIAAHLKRIADTLDPPVEALDSGGTGDGPPKN